MIWSCTVWQEDCAIINTQCFVMKTLAHQHLPIVISASPEHTLHTEGGVFVTDQPPTPPTMGTDILTNPTLPTQLPTDTFGGGFSCEPITAINVCANVGYANASFPNLRGQGTQADANAELNSFLPLIETGCSNAIVHFLCAVYAPFCSPAFRNSRVMPCRDLCLYVRGTCEDELLAVGLPWPTHLNCELFPTRDNSICFGPEDPTRLQIPAIDGVSITPAPPGNHVCAELT